MSVANVGVVGLGGASVVNPGVAGIAVVEVYIGCVVKQRQAFIVLEQLYGQAINAVGVEGSEH